MRLSMYSCDKLFHSFNSANDLAAGSLTLIFLAKVSQTCSIGFRSGDLDDKGSCRIWASSKNWCSCKWMRRSIVILEDELTRKLVCLEKVPQCFQVSGLIDRSSKQINDYDYHNHGLILLWATFSGLYLLPIVFQTIILPSLQNRL